MKRSIFTLLIILNLCGQGFAQIIVNKGIYKANFSNTYHEPRYVSYFLFKGGGDCSRTKFKFKNDDQRLDCASDDDYKGSNYDKGHLANAEDFAFDCAKDELTFRYYNCLPQTANLNRGVWKTNETLIRQWSQTDSIYIICGGVFGSKTIGHAAVPSYCWKVAQSVSTKKVLFCGWFSNTSTATLEEITVPQLEKRLKSKLILLK
jgi:endonuclease G, mitochondrial